MREASRPHTRHWMLSRGVAGIRGATLIVNFPGNPRSIAQTGAAIADALPHALALIADAPTRACAIAIDHAVEPPSADRKVSR